MLQKVKEVRWSDEAIFDLNNITEYLLNNWSSDIAERFLNEMDDFIFRIQINSRSFPLINTNEAIRKCVISKHNSIYYIEELGYVEILRIFDNRQDPKNLKF